MSVGTLHTIYAIDAGGTVIGGIQDQSVSPEVEERILQADGTLEPSGAVMVGANPFIEFSTIGLNAALDVIGYNGLTLDDDPAVFYFEKTLDGGARGGSSAHISLTQNAGMLIPLMLTLQQGVEGTLRCRAQAKYNGTNLPFVYAASQSLPSISVVPATFTLGPVAINGTAVPGVMETSIDFGIQLIVRKSDGDLYPTFVGILARNPTIRIRSSEVGNLNTFGFGGAAATSFAVYARKLSATGTVADATAEHIKISGTTGRVHLRDISGETPRPGGAGSEAMTELMLTPITDGTNAALVIATASAIT